MTRAVRKGYERVLAGGGTGVRPVDADDCHPDEYLARPELGFGNVRHVRVGGRSTQPGGACAPTGVFVSSGTSPERTSPSWTVCRGSTASVIQSAAVRDRFPGRDSRW